MIHSINPIIRQYDTGERPVLVTCSDGFDYVCKMPLYVGTPHKLVCEHIGNALANCWELGNPVYSVVLIAAEHCSSINSRHVSQKLAVGSRFNPNVIDVTSVSQGGLVACPHTIRQLMETALFDMWVANEDRNANNYNLLFDFVESRFVPIDFGCIFNTATFDCPLSQLTLSDSILYSDLFRHFVESSPSSLDAALLPGLRTNFEERITICSKQRRQIVDSVPQEWHVSMQLLENKLNELFSPAWTDAVWHNFTDTLDQSLTSS